MKRLAVGLILVVLLLVPVACAKAPPGISVEEAPYLEPAEKAMVEVFIPEREEAVVPSGGVTEERMIVRNGEISLVVEDVVAARDEIAQLALKFNGYVVSSRISGEEQEMRGYISIRVPDDQFEPVLSELRELAVRVNSESTSSRDVTEEYIDLEARLKNAEATESQYLALLEKAREVEDILRIYDSLSRVRNDIEQLKGRMQYLERTSSMSLISVNLEPEATAKPLARAGWSALEVFKSAVRGIVIFGQWLGAAAIWLLIFSPVWGAIVGIIYWRFWRKKRA